MRETVLAHWANATPPSRSAKVAQEHRAALKKKWDSVLAR
jgi:hypothetical protein